MTSRSESDYDAQLAARLQAFAEAPLAAFDANRVVEAAVAPVPGRGMPWHLIAAATATVALVLVAAAASGALWNGRPPAGGPLSSTGTSTSATPTPRPYTGAADEYLPRLAACLREAGWDVIADPFGDSMHVSPVATEQRPALAADTLACEQEIGTPPTPTPLTEPEIRARYQYLLTARQCLIGLGYAISEPPDEDTFVRTWQNATGLTQDAPWSPYHDVPDAGKYSWEEVNRLCPQVPTPSPR